LDFISRDGLWIKYQGSEKFYYGTDLVDFFLDLLSSKSSNDFYGIGFFSADKVAQSIGLALDSLQRIMAAIKHVLAASREFGHCCLTQSQIRTQVKELIEQDLGDRLPDLLNQMGQDGLVRVREIETEDAFLEPCYYSKSLYFYELYAYTIANCCGCHLVI
jgi:hypothetical protein